MTAEAYPHSVEHVRLIETHVSWVFLAGEFAYKIKRPVCYPFVDMRSPAQRLFFCREELRLNRRFAPDLYLDVVPITVDDGQARIGGTGEAIDHAVRMRQFDTREELDRLLADSGVEPRELDGFGQDLARIHERLPPAGVGERYGSLASVGASLRENLAQVEAISRRAGFWFDSESEGAGRNPPGRSVAERQRGDAEGRHGDALKQMLIARLERAGALIEARHAGGRVRECHGDLHCRNVVRNGGRLIAFDGLEFEPAFRWIDVAEEIAFLFMDLGRRGGQAHANAFVNGYLGEGGDYEAVRLLRLYGAHRALVRAKVAALESEGASDHRAYVDCARELLAPRRPVLILMTGLSGSGKTWLAQRLAPRIGAIHVRSDVERKRLSGLAAAGCSRSGLDQGLYAKEINDSTYRRLARCASDILAGDFAAIADATFQRRTDRALFSRLSADLNVRLILIRCRAPAEVLRARIVDRARAGRDASEANLAVLERQQATFEAIDPGEGLEVIDADTTRPTIVDDIEQIVKSRS
jgi:aminoglycoside phosphotransferase family enzyme/predicted kinase